MKAIVVALLAIGCGSSPDAPADGGSDAGADAPACDPDRPRASPPELIVGPGSGAAALERRVLDAIDAATTSIDVHMYNFTLDNIANRLIAAHGRGVTVRVILDESQGGSVSTRAQLEGGGVEVRYASAEFPNAHAKYLILDGSAGFVLSANFTVAGMDDQRNYAAIDRDPDDVADLTAIFAADWAGTTPALDCSRLVISPADARARVLAMIAAATATLDFELFYLADSAVRSAVISARQRGVAVRVLLADPSDMPDNSTTATTLKDAGVAVRVLANPVVHSKLIVADGVGLIGSHNMSSTSLRDNREVGLMIREGNAMAPVAAQFTADWNAARVW